MAIRVPRTSFAAAPAQGGAGIGLATVRLIAELHGGALELTNPSAGGAQATLRLGPSTHVPTAT